MSHSRLFEGLTLVLIAGFLSVGCQTLNIPPATAAKSEYEYAYGPRWTDYRTWGQLTLGMTKQATIDLLGEPYLPIDALSRPSVNSETLVFKIRPKFYKVREIGTINIGPTGTPVRLTNIKELFPEKSSDTGVWGDVVDVLCNFENGKLVRWFCPTLGQNVDVDSLRGGSLQLLQKK